MGFFKKLSHHLGKLTGSKHVEKWSHAILDPVSHARHSKSTAGRLANPFAGAAAYAQDAASKANKSLIKALSRSMQKSASKSVDSSGLTTASQARRYSLDPYSTRIDPSYRRLSDIT